MKIEELRQTAPDRYLVRFDDGTEMRTSMSVVADHSLYTGREFTDREYMTLLDASAFAGAKSRALKIVAARSISKKELVRKLTEKGETPDNAEAASQWLEEMGYINDEEYAGAVARHFAKKGYGRARIKNEFYRRGVPSELWDAALRDLPHQDDKIDRLLRSKLGDGEPTREELRRATDSLFRRGFSWDEISAAVDRYRQQEKDPYIEI